MPNDRTASISQDSGHCLCTEDANGMPGNLYLSGDFSIMLKSQSSNLGRLHLKRAREP